MKKYVPLASGALALFGALFLLFIWFSLIPADLAVAQRTTNAEAILVEISEIRTDQPGSDNDEYFELSGPAGTPLDNLTYLVIGDGTGGSGVIEAVVSLTGTVIPADGFFLALESTSLYTLTADLTTTLNFENSDNVTHLLVAGFSGADGDDLDTNDDGVFDATPWTEILDSVGLVATVGSGELLYSDNLIGPDGSYVPGHVFYCTDLGWIIGQFDLGVDDTPGAANACPVVRISEIRTDQPSSDNDEYFELSGPAGTPLDNLTYLVIGDGTGGSGVIEAVVGLTGTVIPADGFFLALETTSLYTLTADLTTTLNFENSDNVTHLLVAGFSGADGDDLDTDDDGDLDATPWTEILDSVGLVATVGSGDLLYSDNLVGPDGSYVPGHVFYCPAFDWLIGQFDLGVDDTPGAANVCPVVAISEVRIDQSGSDNDEYFELFGPAGTPLDNLTYLVIGDGTGGSGVIEAVVGLTGTVIPADRFFLALESTSLYTLTADLTTTLNFENSDNVTHLLVAGFSGADGDDLDTDDDGDLDATPWTKILDSVGLVATVGSGDLLYSDNLVGPDGSYVPGHVFYCPDLGWLIGQFDLGVDDTPGAANACPVAGAGLYVEKIGPSAILSGLPLIYDITLFNEATITATSVILTDTLPTGTAYDSDDFGGVANPQTGQYVWDIGEIGAGISLTVRLSLTVDSGVASGFILTNTVNITSTLPDDPTDDNQSQWETTYYEIVPISTARAGSAGEVFAIQGAVMYTPGTFNTTEWALQDDSGGIAVYYNPPPSVAIGDEVVLVATLGGYSNQEQMAAPVLYYDNHGPATPPVPKPFTTGEVATGSTEGWLIQVKGVVSNLSSATCTSTYTFDIDDGSGPAYVYVDSDTGVNLCDMGLGNGSNIRLVGFSTQYGTTYEIKPRMPADVAGLDIKPKISKTAPLLVSPGQVYTYTITVENQTGLELTQVVIQDSLPTNVTLAKILDGGILEDQDISWQALTFPDQTSLNVRFVVTATTDLETIANETYAVVASNFVTPTAGAPVYTFVSDTGRLSIHHIQGSSAQSPLKGITVEDVNGVVTRLMPNGFYMQEPAPDINPLTSEGLFVYTGAAPAVTIGDLVSVDGKVDEYRGMTQLTNPTVSVIGSGTVMSLALNLPVAEGATFEPFEGMLVSFTETFTVDQNYFQGRYGQVTLSAEGRMYNPTNGNGLGDSLEYNLRRMIVLDDGTESQNPAPIPYIFDDNTLRAGDIVTNVMGILDEGIINSSGAVYYRLQPTTTPSFTRVNERTPAPEDVGGNLQVASFNVLNYFNGDGQGGGFPTSRGASTLEEFERQRTKIITALLSLDADVVGLMEIENDGFDQYSAIQDLVNGLNAIAGAGTYAFVTEPAPGTDAIKVAMIYKPGVVTPVGSASNYQVVGREDYDPLFDRPPLAQTFSLNANGETFTVIVNHLKSKSSCPTSGPDTDQGDGQGCWNAKRTAQALGLLDFITELQDTSIDLDVMVIGDLNAYGEEDPVLALVNGGLENAVATFVPAETRYSYVFDGFAGYLDHGLVTSSLFNQITDVTYWHINADEPSVIDYNTEFKPVDLYAPDAYRSSDHDPVLIGLELVGQPTLWVTKAVTLSRNPAWPGDVVTFTLTISNPGTVDAINLQVSDVLPAGLIGDGLNRTITVTALSQVEMLYTARVDPTINGPLTLTNTATVTYGVVYWQASAEVPIAYVFRIYLPMIYKSP